MKGALFIDYFFSLLKKFQELQKLSQMQDSLRIISIETNMRNECVFKIQIIGKSAIFEATPQEIASNDILLEGFSRKDVRTIIYYATQEIAKPPYKILIQDFEEESNKTLFRVGKRGDLNFIKKTANELSADKNLLNQMTQQDAHRVGYVTAMELFLKEKEEIKRLNEAPTRKNTKH